MQPTSAEPISIEQMIERDWPAVRAIYEEGIKTGNATFEKSPPEWASWDAGHLRICRLVARSRDGVLGWAALSPVSSRCVYAGVAEVSVYVAGQAQGRGIGMRLLLKLPNAKASGPCRRGFSRKIFLAWNCISVMDFASWVREKNLARWTGDGEMSS
jgi:GNAT superfamily N-acetyltransferase